MGFHVNIMLVFHQNFVTAFADYDGSSSVSFGILYFNELPSLSAVNQSHPRATTPLITEKKKQKKTFDFYKSGQKINIWPEFA